MKKKYSDKEIIEMQNWLKYTLFGKTSAWGIIYRDMFYRKMNILKKKPSKKDLDLFFSKVKRAGEAINKSPKIRQMYKDIHSLNQEEI